MSNLQVVYPNMWTPVSGGRRDFTEAPATTLFKTAKYDKNYIFRVLWYDLLYVKRKVKE